MQIWINKVKGAFVETEIETKEGHQLLTEGSINNYEYTNIISIIFYFISFQRTIAKEKKKGCSDRAETLLALLI